MPSLGVDDNDTLPDRLLRYSPLDIMTPREQGQISSASSPLTPVDPLVNLIGQDICSCCTVYRYRMDACGSPVRLVRGICNCVARIWMSPASGGQHTSVKKRVCPVEWLTVPCWSRGVKAWLTASLHRCDRENVRSMGRV